ncbi:zinc finger protein 672-like [Thrips palmi]|uniref:Zinc finger protein 672-like n=1 Tax=Thrips palmi TaxID=161013 RepID=A0A6P8ZR19_THRPL|nr:zinc finger protein 672-like [Thrips palmi]
METSGDFPASGSYFADKLDTFQDYGDSMNQLTEMCDLRRDPLTNPGVSARVRLPSRIDDRIQEINDTRGDMMTKVFKCTNQRCASSLNLDSSDSSSVSPSELHSGPRDSISAEAPPGGREKVKTQCAKCSNLFHFKNITSKLIPSRPRHLISVNGLFGHVQVPIMTVTVLLLFSACSSNGTGLAVDPLGVEPGAVLANQCLRCLRMFTTKKNLDRHLCQRTLPRPFQCPQCSWSFMEKSKLVLHIRTHTGEKPYECPTCFAKFSRKDSMDRHIQKTHK